jgi:hypothetical protein
MLIAQEEAAFRGQWGRRANRSGAGIILHRFFFLFVVAPFH